MAPNLTLDSVWSLPLSLPLLALATIGIDRNNEERRNILRRRLGHLKGGRRGTRVGLGTFRGYERNRCDFLARLF